MWSRLLVTILITGTQLLDLVMMHVTSQPTLHHTHTYKAIVEPLAAVYKVMSTVGIMLGVVYIFQAHGRYV